MGKNSMADRATNISLEMDRVIEVDQLGILPFLEIPMARLTGSHIDLRANPYLLARAFLNRPQTIPAKPFFRLDTLVVMTLLARAPGVADQARLSIYLSLFDMAVTAKAARLMIVRG